MNNRTKDQESRQEGNAGTRCPQRFIRARAIGLEQADPPLCFPN